MSDVSAVFAKPILISRWGWCGWRIKRKFDLKAVKNSRKKDRSRGSDGLFLEWNGSEAHKQLLTSMKNCLSGNSGGVEGLSSEPTWSPFLGKVPARHTWSSCFLSAMFVGGDRGRARSWLTGLITAQTDGGQSRRWCSPCRWWIWKLKPGKNIFSAYRVV